MEINAVFEPQKEGGYTAYIPALPGCVSEGDTLKEAKENLLDALQGYLLVGNKRSMEIARKAKENRGSLWIIESPGGCRTRRVTPERQVRFSAP
jgi:predicted RNase H-like HicB family nuclease